MDLSEKLKSAIKKNQPRGVAWQKFDRQRVNIRLVMLSNSVVSVPNLTSLSVV